MDFDINSTDPAKVLNVRDISEVLSELEEQEEPKEESNNDSNKFVIVDDDVGDNTSDTDVARM